jgi:hypothetical protein
MINFAKHFQNALAPVALASTLFTAPAQANSFWDGYQWVSNEVTGAPNLQYYDASINGDLRQHHAYITHVQGNTPTDLNARFARGEVLDYATVFNDENVYFNGLRMVDERLAQTNGVLYSNKPITVALPNGGYGYDGRGTPVECHAGTAILVQGRPHRLKTFTPDDCYQSQYDRAAMNDMVDEWQGDDEPWYMKPAPSWMPAAPNPAYLPLPGRRFIPGMP